MPTSPDACLSTENLAFYVSGDGESREIAVLARHVESCETCRSSVAAALRASRTAAASRDSRPPPSEDGIQVGHAIGRYIVRAHRGSGAMSHVLEAEDPTLGRTVALKIVRSRDDAGDARALREGRALAKLAHPNVVSVFDVGVWSGGVFLAIELVDGTTVKEWAHTRSPRDVVRVFIGLAHGLAAAHRAGLVHRDVKPDNLVVDASGRPRVIDFGLALEAAGSNAVFGGTPAYLAPELRTAAVAGTPQSDQFALALSLHEVLAAGRPPAPLPRDTPGWLARALDRACAERAADRFATLDDFADALERGLGTRQRRIAMGAGAFAIAAVAVVAFVPRHAVSAPCTPSVQAAALAGTWNPLRRAALRAAFATSKLPYAPAITASVEAALDAYATAWTNARVEACEATNVKHAQSAELLDLRMACLEQRRTDLDALIGQFTRGDAPIVEKSLAATSALPLLASCADGARLRTRLPLPRSAQSEGLIAALRKELAADRALFDTGHTLDAKARVRLLGPQIVAAGYQPLTAEWLFLRGTIERRTGEAIEAASTFVAAMQAAELGGDDELKVKAMVGRAGLLGDAGKYADAVDLLELANATIGRLGGDPALAGRRESTYASMAMYQGKFAESRTHGEAAVALYARAHGEDDVRTVKERLNLAQSIERLGDYAAADAIAKKGMADLERLLGAAHPDAIQAHGIYADSLLDQAKFEESLAENQRVLALITAAYGPNASDLSGTYNAIGLAYENLRAYDKALAAYQHARDIAVIASGERTASVALELLNIGNAYNQLKRFPEALATYAQVQDIADETLGPGNLYSAKALSGVSTVYSHTGELAKAWAAGQRAVDLLEEISKDSIDVALAHSALADIAYRQGKPERAVPELEISLRIHLATFGADHPSTAKEELLLADSLWDIGRDRPRAIALAKAALPVFEAAGNTVFAEECKTWLAHRR